MSVQNLRSKFNQSNDCAPLSPPGTSFGVSKFTSHSNNLKNQNYPVANGFKNQNTPVTVNGVPKVPKPSFLHTSGKQAVATRWTPPSSAPPPVPDVQSCSVLPPEKPALPSKENVIQNRWKSPTSLNGLENGQKFLHATNSCSSVFENGGQDDNNNYASKFQNYKTAPPNHRYTTRLTSVPSTECNGYSSTPNITHTNTNHNDNQKPTSRYTTYLTNYNVANDDTTNNDRNNAYDQNYSQYPDEQNWRRKYEEGESLRKNALAQSDKVSKDYADLERKHSTLQQEHTEIVFQFKEKSDQLNKLRKLSEAMCKEYDQLKTQYELETTTMQKAMERASQWYKQNRELKRRSSALMQHVMTVVPDSIPEINDDVDSGICEQDSEIEELRKVIKEMTHEISRLQAELNSMKLKEFEAQEQALEFGLSLEEERSARRKTENELDDMKTKFFKPKPGTFSPKDTDRSSDTTEVGLLQTKLKLTESELNSSLKRAEDAENRILELESRISALEVELQQKNQAPPPPPAPPLPPPPPPPPMPSFALPANQYLSKNRLQRSSRATNAEDDSATEEMANLLGIQRKSAPPQVPGGVIDNIINELKGGRFTLKATEKQSPTKKEDSPPPVVNEMMNILGTLRRQPARRNSFKRTTGNISR